MLVVKKFGGSSVADKERIFNVARRCAEEYQMGNDVIVVLSAMGDTTDELLEKAAEINPYPSKRELDMLLTTGAENWREHTEDPHFCLYSEHSPDRTLHPVLPG